MRIIDDRGNVITDPDLESGKLVEENQPVTYRYEITQHEQGHYETIAEYPNGGKDVEWVVDVIEEGRWVAYDESGEEVEIDTVIPDDAPHEIDIPTLDVFYRYILYTEDELAEIAEQKAQAEAAAQKAEEQQAFLDTAPSYFSALTSAFGEVE